MQIQIVIENRKHKQLFQFNEIRMKKKEAKNTNTEIEWDYDLPQMSISMHLKHIVALNMTNIHNFFFGFFLMQKYDIINALNGSERGKMKPTKCSFNSSFNIWFAVFIFWLYLQAYVFSSLAHKILTFYLCFSLWFGSRYFHKCSIRSMIVVVGFFRI